MTSPDSNTPPSSPPVPSQSTPVAAPDKPPLRVPREPLPTAPAEDATPKPPRTFRQRLLGIGWKGWVRLAVICIAVGAVFEAGGINPFAPDFTASGALAAAGHGLVSIASWILNAGWRPLLVGALVVIPVWLLWRLATTPFRK